MKKRRDSHWLILGALSAVIGMFALFPSSFDHGETLEIRASTLRVDPNVKLSSCAPGDAGYFAQFSNTDVFSEWPEIYHREVRDVVEEQLQPVETIECTSEELLPVTEEEKLYEVASKLPLWDTPEELATLQKNDVGFVLLELLRIYECALIDRRVTLSERLKNELRKKVEAGELPPDALDDYRYADLLGERKVDIDTIEEQLETSRPTLERVLQIVAGSTRLTVLNAELECLQRSSIDLRNGLSLAADTSSCLPRIWDAKDPLRDAPPR